MASVTALPPFQSHAAQQISPNQAPLDSSKAAAPKPAAAVTQDPVPRGPVTPTLNFYTPPEDGSHPFNFVETPPEGQPQRNFGDAYKDVNIKDARGREHEFSTDKHAFATLQGYPHNELIDWNDEENIKTHYYPEVERILLENLPGSPNRVLIFDHTIRRTNPGAPRGPVNRAHIDQTPYSAGLRVAHHLPDEAEKLQQGRYRIVNVWRPLNGAVESDPLTFADSQTVSDGDVVPVEHRYPNRTGYTAAVKHNENHQWYYWSGIKDDERILLQCADSANPMTRAPHSAFRDPRQTSGSKPRESIEVRALVFG